MKKRYGTYLPALVLTALLSGGCGMTDSTKDSGYISFPYAQDVPPQQETPGVQVVFESHDIQGNTVSSDIFSDSKLTMVNVWATYCNPCLQEMPGLGEMAAEYSTGEFRIIGIISDVAEWDPQGVKDYAAELIAQTGADYTHLVLNKSLYTALLTDVSAVPTTFFIDENGIVLKTVVGSMEKSAWEEIINELLEEM